MGVVKAAIGDAVITFMWVFVAATFGLQTTWIISTAGLHGMAWAPPVIMTALLFLLVSIFTLIGDFLGGASFNPTGNAAFYAIGLGGDSISSIALRLPAQAAGAAGGALAILEAIPKEYKHMIRGPSLKVDVQTGAIAEGILTFLINFAVLLIILRGPRGLLAKAWLLAVTTVSLVIAGASYTGPAMNPAIVSIQNFLSAFGWAYVYKTHNTWDHYNVYWISPFIGAMSAAWVFRLLFPPPQPEKQNKA